MSDSERLPDPPDLALVKEVHIHELEGEGLLGIVMEFTDDTRSYTICLHEQMHEALDMLLFRHIAMAEGHKE